MNSLASSEFHEGCAVCGTHYAVDVPGALTQAAIARDLVIFAGAGVSTEAPGLFPETFYEEIEARVRDEPSGKTFPAVMQEFEDRFGRHELVRILIERIDYVGTFQSLQNRTTAFHHELSTIAQLDTIFTTNWDDFFERFAGARPYVLDGDFAFFDTPGRRVMKVHGSISNLSTLVATTSDYLAREADLRESVMGAKLRDFLSTKTILFIGYSLTDSDFQSVFASVIERMGPFRRRAYIVTPVDSPAAEQYGLEHLRTDGGHFLHLLKSELDEAGVHVPDERIERSQGYRDFFVWLHSASEALLPDANTFGVFTQSYQDGLLAALGRIGLLARKGAYSDPSDIESILHSYAHLFATAVEKRRYFDASYIEGYMVGTRSLLLTSQEFKRIPLIQTFSSPMYRSKVPDPHREASNPWWMASSVASIAEYFAVGRDREQTIEWLFELSLAHNAKARRTTGLPSENRRMLSDLRPGQVPQHSEFLDGV